MAKLCKGVRVSGYWKGSKCGAYAEPDDDYCATHKGMANREERFEKARRSRERQIAREAKRSPETFK